MTGPVRAVLDIQALQVDGYADRGIGRYVAAYSAALLQAGRLHAALLAPELPPPSGLPSDLVAADAVRWDSMAETRRLTAGAGPVAYHVTAPFLHTRPGDPAGLAVGPHWAAAGVPRVVTLYDLIPLRAPRHYLSDPSHAERYRTRARWVASADLVLAISEHTRSEALDLLGCAPERVVNIGVGVSPFFSGPDHTDDALWRFHFGALEGRPYVFTVGGSDLRKGTDRLVRAVGSLASRDRDLFLVVAGDLTVEWQRRLVDEASRCGLGSRLVLAGKVDDELLRACYRRAALTVMPSLWEGAGLPVLESAASGTPALASCSSGLVESAATPLALFDPASVEGIAAAVARVLDDPAHRAAILEAQQVRAAASTWAAVVARAGRAMDGLGSELPAGRWRPGRQPLRLAVAGPLPPGGGGVGVYTSQVLASLPPGVCADAVTPSLDVPSVPSGVGYVAASSFGVDVRPASYDAVVYVLGNSAGHLPTVSLALRHPGWLWMHEVRLPALAVTAWSDLDAESFWASMARLLERAYPGRPPLGAARSAGRSNLDLISAGVGLAAPLVERCRGVLVNSAVARRLLLLDLAPLAHHPPVHVLPPACPPVRASGAERSGDLVVALGVVSMSKRPEVLVDAAAVAGCRLAFVGPCPPILAEMITDRARIRGVGANVEVTGAVGPEAWRGWMDEAAMVVQLRDALSGETSAAVLECLSAGLPVLTNMASAAELPGGTVVLIEELSAPAVGQRIAELLGSPGRLRELSEAGQAFAADATFSRLAAELVSVVTR